MLFNFFQSKTNKHILKVGDFAERGSGVVIFNAKFIAICHTELVEVSLFYLRQAQTDI